MPTPEIRYAKTADGVHIAYQVVGDGPVDMVFVMGWVTNIEAMWDSPDFTRFLDRLASFSRLILFDKRGVDLSDRVPEDRLPDLETRMDDVRAVMDAVGSERAVVFGVSEGGPMSMLFAATYPERTIALALYGTVADFTVRGPGYKEDPADYLARTEEEWGSLEFARGEIATWGAPGHESDERLVAWFASYMRKSASRIAGARLVELPGSEHLPWVGTPDAIVDEVERFVVALGEVEAELDRALATVLFTDVAGSTEKAAELGDRRWKEMVEEHHRRVRGQLARYRGVEVDTAGDGFFATHQSV